MEKYPDKKIIYNKDFSSKTVWTYFNNHNLPLLFFLCNPQPSFFIFYYIFSVDFLYNNQTIHKINGQYFWSVYGLGSIPSNLGNCKIFHLDSVFGDIL
jgi:hypothetical protein